MNLPVTTQSIDLSEVLCSIQVKLQLLGWVKVNRSPQRCVVILNQPRLIHWAIAACERSGFPTQTLYDLLDSCPSDRQWYLLRSLLPSDALHALNAKLDAFIQSPQSGES